MDEIKPGMSFSPNTTVTATCTACGGSNVQLAYPVWMRPNNMDEFVDVDWDADPYTYCEDCGEDKQLRLSTAGEVTPCTDKS